MPRKPGIYRNIRMNTVTVLAVDVKAEKTRDMVYTVPDIGDNDKILKYLQKAHNTDKFKIIRIKKKIDHIVRYYMPIERYIKYADVESEEKNYGSKRSKSN